MKKKEKDSKLPQAKVSVCKDDILIEFLDKSRKYLPWSGNLLTEEPIKGITVPGEFRVQSKNEKDKMDDPIYIYMIYIYGETPHKKTPAEFQYEKSRGIENKEEDPRFWRNSISLLDCEISLKPAKKPEKQGEPPFKAAITIRRIKQGLFGIEIDKECRYCAETIKAKTIVINGPQKKDNAIIT